MSQALATGTFTPPLDDLKRAVLELDGPNCLELVEDELRRQSAYREEDVSKTGYGRQMLKDAQEHCGTIAVHNDRGRKNAWNARFGGMPPAAKNPDWRTTILEVFDHNRGYKQARCDFTARLGGRLECRGVTPTEVLSTVASQMTAASRIVAFGPSGDPVAMRLRLMLIGAGEALNQIARKDATDMTLSVTRWFRINASPEIYHAGLINQYAISRVRLLSACGEELVEIENFVPRTFLTRRGGVVIDRQDRSYTERWVVPAKFASVAERLKTAMPGISSETTARIVRWWASSRR